MAEQKIYQQILLNKNNKRSQLAVLVDPDKFNDKLIDVVESCKVDYFFIGGSKITNGDFEGTLRQLKKRSKIPVVIFPGDFVGQLSAKADAILILSVLSGRNPDYLIGKHVESAKEIKAKKIETIPTGYVLIEGEVVSATQKVTNTRPIPNNDVDLIVRTAIAGELLGMKAIYLEAGSGAKMSVSSDIIKKVKKQIHIPLIVGGGINSVKKAQQVINAGADIVVVGNALEKNVNLLSEISKVFI